MNLSGQLQGSFSTEQQATNEKMQYIATFGESAWLEKERNKLSAKDLNRLRQELAMAALTGLLGAADSNGQWTWGTAKDVADCAVEIANEMLRALELKS